MRSRNGSYPAGAAADTAAATCCFLCIVLCILRCVSAETPTGSILFKKTWYETVDVTFPKSEASERIGKLRSGPPTATVSRMQNDLPSFNSKEYRTQVDAVQENSEIELSLSQEIQSQASSIRRMPALANHDDAKKKHHAHTVSQSIEYKVGGTRLIAVRNPSTPRRKNDTSSKPNKRELKKKSKVSKSKQSISKGTSNLKRRKGKKRSSTEKSKKGTDKTEEKDHKKSHESDVGTYEDSGLESEESYAAETFPAKSLEYLRDEIDESVFTWINKDEVKAGGVTCGFLTPPLGSLPNEPYPTIKVYFCMRFATKQPAAKGYILTHCGGPGSLSDCNIYEDVGEKNLKDYNIITFDQRGLGRSWPSFAHEECTYGMIDYDLEDGSTIRIQDPNETSAFEVDPTNEESIRQFLYRQKRRVASCWTCDSCDFQLEATDKSKTYHFLDYSGNQQAIEDIDRFRDAIGAEKISLWGISYGTAIASLYATASPSTVDKLILDSNVTPLPDSLHFGLASAKNRNSRLAYLIFSCSAANVVEPGTCPVEDLGQCINHVSALYTVAVQQLSEEERMNTPSFDFIFQYLQVIVQLTQDWNTLGDVCIAAEAGDIDALGEALVDIIVSVNDAFGATRSFQDVESQPTSELNVLGIPNYAEIMGGFATIPQALILGQSWSGGAYDDEYFIYKARKVDEEYPGYGTHRPARDFMYWFGHNFFWPKTQPTSPAGSPFLTGIVTGVLFDPATPYELTQEMKQAFPNTVLITSQWVTHGIYSVVGNEGDESCLVYFQDYLETGFVPVPDGFVCGSPLPGPFEAGTRRS